MKIVITESQLNSLLAEEESGTSCIGFKYNPKKKVYDNENEYNCAVKFYEDAVNLRKAYLFQKQNCNWRGHLIWILQTLNDIRRATGKPLYTFDSLLKTRTKNLGYGPGDKVSLGKNYWGKHFDKLGVSSNPDNNDQMKSVYGDQLIYNYFKNLKFNFPVRIGIYSSPDLIHKYLKPQGTYYDGIAFSPIYGDPGEKPTLNKEKPITNVEKPIELPKQIIQPEIEDNPQFKGIPSDESVYGPAKSLIGFMRGRDFITATGEYTIGMNKVDKDLINNKKELEIYLRSYLGGYLNKIY